MSESVWWESWNEDGQLEECPVCRKIELIETPIEEKFYMYVCGECDCFYYESISASELINKLKAKEMK